MGVSQQHLPSVVLWRNLDQCICVHFVPVTHSPRVDGGDGNSFSYSLPLDVCDPG